MSDHRGSAHIDDATLRRKLNQAEKTRRPLTLGAVTIYAPDARGYWRLLAYSGSRRLNRSGGRSIETCVKAYRRLDDEDRDDSSTTVEERRVVGATEPRRTALATSNPCVNLVRDCALLNWIAPSFKNSSTRWELRSATTISGTSRPPS